MIWNSFRCAVWVMLAFLLVSCQFMPTQTGNQKPIAADVRPAFGTKADNSGQSQTLMAPGQLLFSSQVTPQTFALINKPDAKGKFWWVRFTVAKEIYPKPAQTEISGDDEDDDSDERAEEKSEDADHDDRPGNHRIWIPENGIFKVNLVAGSRFQVIDSDARDQEATVQVPTALLSTYLRLEGPKSKESKKNKPAIERKLTLAEALYNVNQTVSLIGPEREGKRDRDEQKQPWLKLGNRPFPVPTSWSSPEGQKYVLNFSNQGVQRFVTRWYRAQTGAQLDYPVGLNEIGPAGGTVEFPGIAKLEIPAGALAQPTIVRMSQILQATQPVAFTHTEDFAAPIVSIQPDDLPLQKEAILWLQTDIQRLGSNHPAVLDWTESSLQRLAEDPLDWGHLDHLTYGRPASAWTPDMPAAIQRFGVFSKLIDSRFKPDHKVQIYEPPPMDLKDYPLNGFHSGNGFKIQAEQELVVPFFRIKYFSSDLFSGCPAGLECFTQQEIEEAAQKLIAAYLDEYIIFYHQNPGTQMDPSLSVNLWNIGKIPVVFGYLDPQRFGIARVAPFRQKQPSVSAEFRFASGPYYRPAHEAWHLYQFRTITGKQFENLDKYYPHHAWLFEGPATFMSGYLANESPKSAYFKPEEEIYQKRIQWGQRRMQKPLRRQNAETYRDPQGLGDPGNNPSDYLSQDPYVTVNFFSYLAKNHPLKEGILARLAEEWADHVNVYDSPTAVFDQDVQTLNTVLGPGKELKDTYPAFALDAFSENYLYFPYQTLQASVDPIQTLSLGTTTSKSVSEFLSCLSSKHYLIPQSELANKKSLSLSVSHSSSLADEENVVMYRAQYVKNGQQQTQEGRVMGGQSFDFEQHGIDNIQQLFLVVANSKAACSYSVFKEPLSLRDFPDFDKFQQSFKLQFALSPPAPPPSLQWISINPNGVPSFIVRRPGVCALSGLQLVNFTYINPTTGEDAVPQEPMSVTLTTELGTGTYPLLRVVPRPNIPPAHAVYTAWVDECAYQDGFSMYGVATATVPYRRSFRGTFTLVDAAGNRSNTVDMNWAVFP